MKTTDPDGRIKLQIYYTNRKSSNLLLRNNLTHKSYFVYRITCKRGNCEVLPFSYIDMATKLSRRHTCHLATAAAKHHLREKQSTNIIWKFLEENTTIVDIGTDVRRLPILEALYNKDFNPKLNVQADDLRAHARQLLCTTTKLTSQYLSINIIITK